MEGRDFLGVLIFRCCQSEQYLYKFKSLQSSVWVLVHVLKLNVCCYESSVYYTHIAHLIYDLGLLAEINKADPADVRVLII